MTEDALYSGTGDQVLKVVENQLDQFFKGEKKRRFARFMVAALGSIPWVGGFINRLRPPKRNGKRKQQQIGSYNVWRIRHGESHSDL